MLTNKSVEQRLGYLMIAYMTYILVGSIIVSKSIIDFIYLIVFYTYLILAKVQK